MTGRSRTGLLVAGVPLAVGAAGLLALLLIRADLPDPVATHWGRGGPDGFTARDRVPPLALLGPGLGVLVGGLIAALARGERAGRRVAAGTAAGVAAFVTLVLVGSLWRQRGLADAATAPDVDGVLVVALVVALLVAAAAAALVPADPPGRAIATGPVPSAAPRLPLAPGERVAWSAWTAAPAGVLGILALALVPTLVLAAVGIAPAFLLLVAGLVVLLAAATLAVRVWVDERGLTVRSPLGWPTWRVPLAEVAAAAAVDVHPLRDFGGWGYRLGRGGRSGVVLRRGPALEVTRGDGRRFAVTVDGAAEAAALLTALTARSRG